MADDCDDFRARQIFTGIEGATEAWARPKHVEQLGRTADSGHEAHRIAGDFKRGVVRPVGGDALESWERGTEVEEFFLGPRSVEPEHADLRLARDRQRVEEER